MLFMILLAAWVAPLTLPAQSHPCPARADRIRVAEARRLAATLGVRLWPGLNRTPLAILLVTDSTEYLFGHPRPSPDFTMIGADSVTGLEIRARSRVYAPTLLATFPAVGGLPTIVVGTAQHTGKSSSDWVLTLLHEHFHQWQYSLPDYYKKVGLLGLSGGDSTGMWMLNYPFPYDSAPVQNATREWARTLSAALDAPKERRLRALKMVRSAWRELAGKLTGAELRYLEFQLWQEGVARFIEYEAARLAAKGAEPAAEFRTLPDYQPYDRIVTRHERFLRRELGTLDIAKDRRVSFYPLGAALAQVLDNSGPEWRRGYVAEPLTMTGLLSSR